MKRKRAATTKETVENSNGCPNADIPHEVLLQILQKLCVKALMNSACVSKLWLESTLNNQQFIEAHLLESQKNPILLFDFFPKPLTIYYGCAYQTNHLYYLRKDEFFIGKEKASRRLHKLTITENNYRKNVIGYCNGLVCFLAGGQPSFIIRGDWSYLVIEIISFSKLEKLSIVSRIHNPEKLCAHGCGFGYDCSSNKYKILMRIFNFHEAKSHKYLVLTLGSRDTQLWREIKSPSIPQGYDGERLFHYINGALYWWLCENGYRRALLSFDLHEETFQAIKLPEKFYPDSSVKKTHTLLEYKKCLCVARIRSGAVELHVLNDRIKQVWVKETITFDLPVTVCPSTNHYRTMFTYFPAGNAGRPTASIRIIEFNGKMLLYWGKSLLNIGRRSRFIQFYDLQSRELTKVRVGSKCGSYYRVNSYVESLISLRGWATKDGIEGGELGRNKDKSTVAKIEDMFKLVPASPSASISFFSSLSGKP